MTTIKFLTVVLGLLSFIGIVGASPACRPSLGISKAACLAKVETCNPLFRYMKFGGPGCRNPKTGKKMGDGGCQCVGYCGYKCKAACVRDPQCNWRAAEKRCYNGNFAGGPMPNCVTCFHSSTTVQLESGAIVTMSDVKYGDRVLAFDEHTKEAKFSTVVGFTGYFPNTKALAMRLYLKGAAKPLLLTPHHLVFASPDGSMDTADFYRSDAVKTGFTLFRNFVGAKVTKIASSMETGWITPLTKDGTIVAGDVMASCHTTGPHQVVRILYSPLQMYLDMFPRPNGTTPDELNANEMWYAYGFRRSVVGESAGSMIKGLLSMLG